MGPLNRVPCVGFRGIWSPVLGPLNGVRCRDPLEGVLFRGPLERVPLRGPLKMVPWRLSHREGLLDGVPCSGSLKGVPCREPPSGVPLRGSREGGPPGSLYRANNEQGVYRRRFRRYMEVSTRTWRMSQRQLENTAKGFAPGRNTGESGHVQKIWRAQDTVC